MHDKVKRLWGRKKELNITIDKEGKERLKKVQEWMRKMDMAVIVSEEAGEEEKFEKAGLDIKFHRKRMATPDDNGQELEDKFKDPANPLQLVFICSMWLTGFDAVPGHIIAL